MIYEGFLSSNMSPQIIASLLSIFVCDGGIKEENIIPEEIKEL